MSDKKTPAHIFTVTVNLPESRQLTINGNFYEGQTEAEANETLDKVMRITERQRQIHEIPLLEAERDAAVSQLEKQIQQLEATQKEVAEKGKKAPPQMTNNLMAFQTNIESIRRNIQKADEKIENLKAKVGM